eukprot:Clim_evm8s25 gene=Clim_evmTU8s25
MSLKALDPPDYYGVVLPGVYRASLPDKKHFPYIEILGLKSLIVLSPQKLTKSLSNFLDQQGIKVYHPGVKTWKMQGNWKGHTEELMKESLELLLNTDLYPTMISCDSGIHQTGMLVGCLRRMQGWMLSSVLSEYRLYASHRGRYINEQFIELFDVDLVPVPEQRPSWFLPA